MVLTMGLRRSLALDAEAEALVSDESRLSSREMVDRIARLASVLRDLGMQDDDRVAMLAPNGQYYIEFYFGVLWGGGIVVPVNSRFALLPRETPEMLISSRETWSGGFWIEQRHPIARHVDTLDLTF
jgi:acyl-CoA synthetase (AMP-forming)/AMP-acid ligase II